MKNVRAVLFDAGGTLIHVDGPRLCGAAGVAFEAASFRRAEASAVDAVRRLVLAQPDSKDADRLPLYLDTMLRGLGLAEEPPRSLAARRVAAEHGRSNLWSRPAEGSAQTLEALRERGYRMACVSNADGRVRGLLQAAGLTPWLEFVIDSAEVGVEKPDPRIFRTATERLGLEGPECAYVGDIYEIDVVGAQGAGLAGILIGDAPAPASVLRVPDLPTLLPLFPGFQ